jgi:hypothetical protein
VQLYPPAHAKVSPRVAGAVPTCDRVVVTVHTHCVRGFGRPGNAVVCDIWLTFHMLLLMVLLQYDEAEERPGFQEPDQCGAGCGQPSGRAVSHCGCELASATAVVKSREAFRLSATIGR